MTSYHSDDYYTHKGSKINSTNVLCVSGEGDFLENVRL